MTFGRGAGDPVSGLTYWAYGSQTKTSRRIVWPRTDTSAVHMYSQRKLTTAYMESDRIIRNKYLNGSKIFTRLTKEPYLNPSNCINYSIQGRESVKHINVNSKILKTSIIPFTFRIKPRKIISPKIDNKRLCLISFHNVLESIRTT